MYHAPSEIAGVRYSPVRLAGHHACIHSSNFAVDYARAFGPLENIKREFPLTTCLHGLLKPLRRLHFLVARILQNPVAATAHTFTNPFHFAFHHSIPDFSLVVIDAPLFHYCEMLLQQEDFQGFGGGLRAG